MRIAFLVLSIVVASFTGGCVVSGTVKAFKIEGLDRAAFEMSCPKEQIELTQLPNATVGVTGCGKKLVYVDVRGHGWVLNSDTQPAE